MCKKFQFCVNFRCFLPFLLRRNGKKIGFNCIWQFATNMLSQRIFGANIRGGNIRENKAFSAERVGYVMKTKEIGKWR